MSLLAGDIRRIVREELGERDRLRAEGIADLQAALNKVDQMYFENISLRAENERLRAALRGLMLDHEWKSIDKDNMEYQVRVNCYTRNKLLAALEPKP